MTMSNGPYVPSFPATVDAALPPTNVMDAALAARWDQQIRGLQNFAIAFNRVTLKDQDQALTPAQNVLQGAVLTGTLTAGRTITIPTVIGQGQRHIVLNETTQILTFIPSTGGSSTFTISPGGGAWFVFDGSNLFLIAGGSGGSSGIPPAPGSDGNYVLHVSSGVATWTAIASGDASSIRTVVVDASLPTLVGQTLRYDGTKYVVSKLNSDDILPGLTHSLSIASGGSAVEVGQTGIDPTFNHVPALNSGAPLTAATITDATNANPASRFGSANGFHGAGSPPYTAPSTPGNMTWTCAFTYNGNNYTDSATVSAQQTWGYGTGTAGDATSAVVVSSSKNATLAGGTDSGTLTGAIASNFVGVTATISPSSSYVYFRFPASSGTPTIIDQTSTFQVLTDIVGTYTYTNQFGKTWSENLIRTRFLQNGTNIIYKRTL